MNKVKCQDCFRMRPNKCGEKFCTGWDGKEPFFIDDLTVLRECGYFEIPPTIDIRG